MRQRPIQHQHKQRRRHIVHPRQPRQVIVRQPVHQPREQIRRRSGYHRVELLLPRRRAVQAHPQPPRLPFAGVHLLHPRRHMHFAPLLPHLVSENIKQLPETAYRIAQLLFHHTLVARLHPRVRLAPHPSHPHLPIMLLPELAAHHRPPEHIIAALTRVSPQPLVRRNPLILPVIPLPLQIQHSQP